jgi:hypothetical protein
MRMHVRDFHQQMQLVVAVDFIDALEHIRMMDVCGCA